MEDNFAHQPADIMTERLSIVAYRPEHQPWFEKLNREWIEKYFHMEVIDRQVLEQPDIFILATGGKILMAVLENEVVGTAALKVVDDETYEFTKMAVDINYRGLGIGQALTEACIDLSWSLGAKRVILYSSTRLVPAITLYKKLGFVEIPVDGVYERSDIKMELTRKQP